MRPSRTPAALAAGLMHLGTRRDDDGRPGTKEQVRWSATTDITADIVSLDEFLPPLEGLTFMKVDIERAEVFALRGAKRVIDQHLPVVVCEINPWYLEGFGPGVADLTSFYVFIAPARIERFAPLLGSDRQGGQ